MAHSDYQFGDIDVLLLFAEIPLIYFDSIIPMKVGTSSLQGRCNDAIHNSDFFSACRYSYLSVAYLLFNFFAFFYFSFGAYDAQRSWTRILALFWDLGNSKILHRLYSIQVSPYHELNYEHMSSWAEWFYFMPWFDDLSFLEKIFTTNSRSVVFFWIIYCYDFWILNYSSLRVDEAIVTAVQKIWTRPNSI